MKILSELTKLMEEAMEQKRWGVVHAIEGAALEVLFFQWRHKFPAMGSLEELAAEIEVLSAIQEGRITPHYLNAEEVGGGRATGKRSMTQEDAICKLSDVERAVLRSGGKRKPLLKFLVERLEIGEGTQYGELRDGLEEAIKAAGIRDKRRKIVSEVVSSQ